PGTGRDPAATADLGRDARSSGAPARPPADGAYGPAARDRQASALPRERRVELRERGDLRRRRRPQRRLRHARIEDVRTRLDRPAGDRFATPRYAAGSALSLWKAL